MAIYINEERQQFHLTNGQISYIFHVMKNGQLGHLYYGQALTDREDFTHFQTYENIVPYTTHTFEGDADFSLETVKQEFPLYGKGDFREAALQLEDDQQIQVSDFSFQGYEIEKGKPKMEGLPFSFAQETEAETLTVRLVDQVTGAEIRLFYTIFENLPILTRSHRIKNGFESTLEIKRLMSLTLDLPDADYDLMHLSGAWARERHVKKRKLEQGIQSISSNRGASSHLHNPYLMLKRPAATEHQGEAIGLQFIYSGNFLAQAEVDPFNQTRLSMGIHPESFQWTLEKGESLQSPEAVLSFSDKGLNGMSQALHNWQRSHLISPEWMKKERPILINNWEATYFDFNEEKLDAFTTEAANLGIELFVLDDGWFGKRDDDTSSLGDWFVDKRKLPNGIGSLSRMVKQKGLQFGLWFEPEMISPKSELMKDRPDWVIGSPGRPQTLGRNQMVLDFSNPEVVDYLYERMSLLIEEADLDYIKWDMNRNITEPFSQHLRNQGEFYHRYILGVYDLYERLTTRYPNVLFESCAGGGGRFDLGMMYYAPQAWASDDTDAVERLKIQYGTSLGYPLATIGSHVSAVPNHQTLRETPLKFRGDVAYFGTFGYELDPSQLSEEEKADVKQQVEFFKKVRKLISQGTFYRLKSPFEGEETAWMACSANGKQAIVGWYKENYRPNPGHHQTLKLKGLQPEKRYEIDGFTRSFYGDELMNRGLPLGKEFNGANSHQAERGGDYQSRIFLLKEY
ncbi:alpha-galactosidase [Halobacillus halophilus]|uniref:alpha-galactosidase n=1 Tax=Halobacillus halophilus TaxID=1570 RepID=UPI001CD4FF9F|nr:alpha-galactosidase [Halobacillus halophilus]MCA1010827.1 alpha-galactosidase [Halobacillus halophilus]